MLFVKTTDKDKNIRNVNHKYTHSKSHITDTPEPLIKSFINGSGVVKVFTFNKRILLPFYFISKLIFVRFLLSELPPIANSNLPGITDRD